MTAMDGSDQYKGWGTNRLISALVQAEGDIKALQAELAEVAEERDRYHREERDGAKIIGGILRVLQENYGALDERFLGALVEGLPLDVRNWAGEPIQFAQTEPARFRHRQAPISEGMGRDACVCGAQWLVQSGRCVNQLPGSGS